MKLLRRTRCSRLAAPDDEVVHEHGADDGEDKNDVDDAHPPRDHRSEVLRVYAVRKMHRRQREFLSRAFVTLAARRVEIGFIDGRVRVARRQDVVDAVAARAIGGHHRAAFRSEAVIAVHVGGDAVGGDAEFAGEAHALVAAGAGVARKVLLRDGRIGIVMRLDGMDAVAVRADRRKAVAPCDGLAVDALNEGLRDLRVALAACLRDVEFRDRGRGIVRGADGVRAMTIRAYGGFG